MSAPAATLPEKFSTASPYPSDISADAAVGLTRHSPPEHSSCHEPTDTPSCPKPDDHPGVVLVVDRIESNRRLTAELLRRQRFAVLLAGNSESALRQIDAQVPDLVLLDLTLPGIDGVELCRRLQRETATRDVPVLLITAAHDASIAARGLTAGAVDFVTRPFHDADLVARVATRIAQKNTRDSRRPAAAPNGQPMSAVAHDLKNPLTSIRLAAHSLRQGLEPSDPRLEMANIVVESCEELLGLIESRLSCPRAREAIFADSGAGGIDLLSVLDRVVQQNGPDAQRKGIKIEAHLPRHADPRVEAESHALARVLDNLLSNAIKFSPPGSEVTVAIERVGQPAGWRVLVQDHGPGCTPDDRKHLLEPGESLRARADGDKSGIGLGLSTARDLVDKLHGRIGYMNTAGGGATFWVELPAHAA